MAISLGVSIILGVYILAMGFTFWFCVIADPDKSPTAKFISQTLPAEFMKMAGKVVGNKGVTIIEAFMERLLAIIYLTAVLGGFSCIVWYSYPKARESTHVPDYHLTVGYFMVFLALYTWRLTMTTSPGIITKETIQYFDHFPYDDLLYVEGRQDKRHGIPRLPRSKFDRLKNHQHVARFDHYCGWVASTIGEENYRLFLLFVFTQWVMCVYATKILTAFFIGEIKDKKLLEVTFFDRTTGKEYPADKWIIFQYLFHKHLIEAGILAIVAVMSLAVGGFFAYHCYITSKGMTTNEHYKWGEVRKWHKAETKKYEEFIANNHQAESVNSNNEHDDNKAKPFIPDGDVTCTGGDPATENENNNDKNYPTSYTVEDPGPMPENLYDRGFVENWKEVLFPISLRRRKAAGKAAGKPKAP